MRLSKFLFLSVTLHTMVLSYPFVLKYPANAQFTPLIVDFIEGNFARSYGDGIPEGKAAKRAQSAPKNSARQIAANPIQRTERTEPVLISKEIPSAPIVSSDVPTGIETVLAAPTSTNAIGNVSLPQINGSGGGGPGGDVGSASSGSGISGSGSGSGTGRGDGIGESKFVQASYAYSPKPEYPAPARKEGKEGRVLLRVLVDEEGKTKTVEINRSSGSEALDRAATEAIKHWRFSPARDGDKRVESWIRVPIDFLLQNAKN
jgi:protein TonB